MIVYVSLNVEQRLRNRATYAVETVLNAAGVGYAFRDRLHGNEEIVLCYGGSSCPGMLGHRVWIQCPCCGWLLDPELSSRGFGRIGPSLRYLACENGSLPFWGEVSGGRGEGWLVEAPRGKKGACRLRVDLFGNAFLHISRLEEWFLEQRDQWGRFEARHSLLGNAGLVSWPVVDGYIRAFGQVLERCCERADVPLIRKALWPDGQALAVCLTHDVDRIRKWTWKRVALESLKAVGQAARSPRGGAGRLFGMALSIARRENPYWNLEALLEDEDEFGAGSTFFFSTQRKVKYDPSYAITDGRIGQAIERLRAENREVGLHATYGAYGNVEELKAEHSEFARCTGVRPTGVRFHYLRLDEKSSLANAERAGLGYDATLGYAEREGFRAGTSVPFCPYDFLRDGPIGVLEVPLCLMDKTLTDYRGYDAQSAESVTRGLWEAVRKHHGLLCVLIHQASYDASEYPYLRSWYRNLLEWVRDEGAFCATAQQIAEWWKARTAFKLLEANRSGAVVACKFACSQDLARIRLTLMHPSLRAAPKVEVDGCEHEICGSSAQTQLALGPIEMGREIEVLMQP